MRSPILIVDDDVDSCTTTAEMLRTLGYEADVACSGRAALNMADATPYSLAIIDYLMPEMNGVELFRRMRQYRPDLVGIFLTGFTTIDVVYPAIEAGILRILPKPVEFKELAQLIVEHVEKTERIQIVNA